MIGLLTVLLFANLFVKKQWHQTHIVQSSHSEPANHS